jgi:hypothetical protein
MGIPDDIKEKISQLFNSPADRQEAEQLLQSLWTTSLNVGSGQLARSILVLSEGQISAIREIIESGFHGDPRDIIMDAEKKAGNPGHYFSTPFDAGSAG